MVCLAPAIPVATPVRYTCSTAAADSAGSRSAAGISDQPTAAAMARRPSVKYLPLQLGRLQVPGTVSGRRCGSTSGPNQRPTRSASKVVMRPSCRREPAGGGADRGTGFHQNRFGTLAWRPCAGHRTRFGVSDLAWCAALAILGGLPGQRLCSGQPADQDRVIQNLGDPTNWPGSQSSIGVEPKWLPCVTSVARAQVSG